jgi:D-alanyl-D-alanine carboxypeptidase
VRGAAPLVLALAVIALCAGGAAWITARDDGSDPPSPASAAVRDPEAGVDLGGGTAPSPLAVRLRDRADPVRYRPRRRDRPRAGLLFDVGTGQVLWRRAPLRRLPMASLTKMMTALLAVERLGPRARVPITAEALRYQGSAVGMRPQGRRIPVRTMLHGLLLPSGNDAARALAIRVAGSVPAFVRLMNRRAGELGLRCTRYSSPDGYRDRGNHTCAADLAALARAVLRRPRLAAIVRRPQAVLPFPVKGGRLYLTNNNPLLRTRYPGVTGLKTGYTDAAGLCIVATARRGPVHLGVVLLHTPDWDGQARRLLDRGFAAAARG